VAKQINYRIFVPSIQSNMQKTLLFLVLLPLWACQSNIETVESTEDDGTRVRYERRRKDQTREGKFERFYPTGTLAESATYKSDTLEGERRTFHQNGAVDEVEHYVRGVLHGSYQRFRSDGSKYIEQTFQNGAFEGWSLRYYPNGQVEERVMLVHGEENGPFQEYYENGKIKAEGTYMYHDESAVEHGELREYDSTGTLVRVADCNLGWCKTRKK
jgi:antitoxin component YwqK of YwqJK toxin-antitoxin module